MDIGHLIAQNYVMRNVINHAIKLLANANIAEKVIIRINHRMKVVHHVQQLVLNVQMKIIVILA
jgi:hypothetical protein